MVPDDEVATARKVFGAINSKTKDENTITTALDYLDKMTYVQKLNNKEDRDKAFRDVFLEEFSELFDDVDEVRTYLQNHISDSPYHWLGNKAVPEHADTRDTEAIKRLATAYLKLLFPNVRNEFDVDKMEFRDYCLTPAMKMRRIIKLQQGMIDSEYKNKDVPCLMVRE